MGCIVGLILLLLLFVLLCPICYKADGEFHGKDKRIRVKLRYLLGLVRGDYIYPEPGNIVFKVAWFTLYDSGAEDEVEDEIEDANTDADAAAPASEEESAKTASAGAAFEETENRVSEAAGKEIESISDSGSKAEDVKANNAANSEGSAGKEKKKKEPLKSPIYYIKKAFENFKHKVIAKIKLLYKEFNFYKKLLFHEDTKKLLSTFKKQLIKILKVIIPKKGRCNIEYGMDSPDTTAYIFGVYSLLFFKKTKRYVVIPNFDQKCLEGDFEIKGYFNIFSILIKALPIILSKKLRITKARIDRHFENMEKAKRKEEKRHETMLGALEEEYSVS
ncbi:MAG: hypothetical protein IKR35_06550 [Lachnospiraceae bacterium]|nr:hypothetical protein [Lachnospiraceae bacterium]